jgi:hypothetical protein
MIKMSNKKNHLSAFSFFILFSLVIREICRCIKFNGIPFSIIHKHKQMIIDLNQLGVMIFYLNYKNRECYLE